MCVLTVHFVAFIRYVCAGKKYNRVWKKKTSQLPLYVILLRNFTIIINYMFEEKTNRILCNCI